MKTLAFIGVAVSIIALGLGAYLQFSVVPEGEEAELRAEIAQSVDAEAYYASPQNRIDFDLINAKTDVGEIVLLAGGIAFLLSIVPALKKQKIAWLGVLLGLGTLFLGAAYGTHMFS